MVAAMTMQKGAVIQGKGGRFVGAGLTDKQRAFIREYVRNGGNASAAADSAGYGQGHARAWELMQNPRILAAVKAEHSRIIGGELASVAVNVLRDILTDPEGSPKLKLDAAKTVLDRAGHIAPKAEGQDNSQERDIDQMSLDELRAFVQRAENDAIAKAKPIIEGEATHDTSPNPGDDDTQVIGITEQSPV